ncbi:MAG: carbamoyltransferase [Flavobacteriales bacterium]|nr:carbamoyltransferase [Flavobacteriales bacterium]
MNILGISAFYHDSAAAIVVDGKILAAVQEERFTRIKQDSSFPSNAVKYCLEYSGLDLNELDAIVFYDKPLLKFERLLETYYGFAPKGIRSFIKAIPVWLNEKMFLKRLIHEALSEIDENYDKRKSKLLFPEHHLSHAASAFYPSPYEEAAIITVDGVGEWATASFCHGKGKDIEILHELKFPHSVGLLYSAFTYFLGFKVNSGEYKLMGLAPYGNADGDEVKKYVGLIKSELIKIHEDGSLWMNQSYFNYATGLTMVKEKKWEKLFGMALRDPESEMEQCHCDLGLAIQIVTEEIVIAMARHLKKLTGADNLCLAGGVALNCVANGKLINEKIFDSVYIQPAAGDAGGALGAALAVQHIYFGEERKIISPDSMSGAYLGPEFSSMDIELTARKFKAKFTHFEDFESLAKKTASAIAEGNAIGWFQGRMEFGPRALGNRSILGDARNKEMQKKLNLKIKYRESFRPFAPSVLSEKSSEYFDYQGDSPYMLIVQPVVESRRETLPENYKEFSINDKLYFNRSDIPSITHIDFSARIQTVHKNTNYEYWTLIKEFENLTGYGLIVNTSFNVRGEPIVCTPEDAYRCMMRTEMDYLVMGNYFFSKKDQPEWMEKDNWQEEFVLD